MALELPLVMKQSKRILDLASSLASDASGVNTMCENSVKDYRNDLDDDGNIKDQADAAFRVNMVEQINKINYAIKEIIFLGNYIQGSGRIFDYLKLDKVRLNTKLTNHYGWSAKDDIDLKAIFDLLADYSQDGSGVPNRSDKYHNTSVFFPTNEIHPQEEGQDVPDLRIDLDNINAIVANPGERNIDRRGHQEVNLQQVVDAIKDIYGQYIRQRPDGKYEYVVSGIEYDRIYNSNNIQRRPPISIKAGASKYDDIYVNNSISYVGKSSTNLRWAERYTNVNAFPRFVRSVYYPNDPDGRDVGPTTEKYCVCGTVDASNNLKKWQICKVYSQSESIFYGMDSWTVATWHSYYDEYGYYYTGSWGRNRNNRPTGYYTYHTEYARASKYNYSGVYRCISNGSSASSMTVYPRIYFNPNSPGINGLALNDIFDDLKNTYIAQIKKIWGDGSIEDADYELKDVNMIGMYKDIIGFSNKSITSVDDAVWLYKEVMGTQEKIQRRVDFLYSVINDRENYQDLYNILMNRLNKSDGTLWQWYSIVLSTDMMQRASLKKLYNSYSTFNKMAVYLLFEDVTASSNSVLIEADLNSYYSVHNLSKTLRVGEVVCVCDNLNYPKELTIARIQDTTGETATGELDENGELKMDYMDQPLTRTVRLKRITFVGMVSFNFSIAEKARLCAEL